MPKHHPHPPAPSTHPVLDSEKEGRLAWAQEQPQPAPTTTVQELLESVLAKTPSDTVVGPYNPNTASSNTLSKKTHQQC